MDVRAEECEETCLTHKERNVGQTCVLYSWVSVIRENFWGVPKRTKVHILWESKDPVGVHDIDLFLKWEKIH